jgi:hypothetical protein
MEPHQGSPGAGKCEPVLSSRGWNLAIIGQCQYCKAGGRKDKTQAGRGKAEVTAAKNKTPSFEEKTYSYAGNTRLGHISDTMGFHARVTRMKRDAGV